MVVYLSWLAFVQQTCTHTQSHTHTHTLMHTCTCIHTYAHTHTLHTSTQTRTQSRTLLISWSPPEGNECVDLYLIDIFLPGDDQPKRVGVKWAYHMRNAFGKTGPYSTKRQSCALFTVYEIHIMDSWGTSCLTASICALLQSSSTSAEGRKHTIEV